MYAKLNKIGKTALASLALLLIAILVAVCTNGLILFRTYRPFYDMYTKGMLINLSQHPVEIRSYEPLIYELSDFGWLPPFYFFTIDYYPKAYEKDLVQPRSILRVNMSFLGKTEERRWILLEQPYFYAGHEYAVYSNRLRLDKSDQLLLFREPPPALVETPSIHVEIIEPYVVALSNNLARAVLSNNSTTILWFNPICSDIEVDNSWPSKHNSYATLQRQTNEGTWQVLRPDRSQGTTMSKLIRIEPGETVRLFLGDGYPPANTLEPGVYRWHLVYYIDPYPQCDSYQCDSRLSILSGAHLFTETFKQ